MLNTSYNFRHGTPLLTPPLINSARVVGMARITSCIHITVLMLLNIVVKIQHFVMNHYGVYLIFKIVGKKLNPLTV